MSDSMLVLHRRTRRLTQADNGRRTWRIEEEARKTPAHDTGLLICDVWDNHWCRGAVEREAEMIGRLNQTVSKAREKGVLIIHAPSDTMDFYSDAPSRRRAFEAPETKPPAEISHDDPPLPVDASDGGCDTDRNDG